MTNSNVIAVDAARLNVLAQTGANEMTTATIPDDVIEGLMAVRATARTNMFARRNVADIAEELGFYDTCEWVRDQGNDSAYVAWVCGK